jgi:hypothetical protein
MRRLMILALALSGSPGPAWAQDAGAEGPAYCSNLKQVAALAVTKERFASIAGKPREGNFADTRLTLTGWQDCSLYGPATYTCDSRALGSAEDAEAAQARILREIRACLGEAWSEAKERSSSRYVVLHSALRPISITLSTDETDAKEHVVRLILFVRRN